MLNQMKFERNFYLNDTFEIAEDLLGATLHTNIENEVISGKIVELEIYLGRTDKASHAYGGRRTKRNEVMYHKGGIAYIYLIYGLHSLFNIVIGKENDAIAILIRALEPVNGIEIMEKRRDTNNVLNLTSGPGKLCAALKISGEQNGISLTGETIWIEPPAEKVPDNKIIRAKRIGIDYAEEDKDKLWRFYIKDNPFVSKKVHSAYLNNNREIITRPKSIKSSCKKIQKRSGN